MSESSVFPRSDFNLGCRNFSDRPAGVNLCLFPVCYAKGHVWQSQVTGLNQISECYNVKSGRESTARKFSAGGNNRRSCSQLLDFEIQSQQYWDRIDHESDKIGEIVLLDTCSDFSN